MARWEAETERGENSHRSTFTGRWKKFNWKGDDRNKICVHICILYSDGLTRHMYSTCTLWHLPLRSYKWPQTGRQMGRKGGECADCRVHAVAAVSVYIEVRRREHARLPRTNSQIVLCLFLEWRDRPSCHLPSLDWLASLPVALAPHTKPTLISEPRGVLALEF